MVNPKNSVPIVIKKETKYKLDTQRKKTDESYDDVINEFITQTPIIEYTAEYYHARKEAERNDRTNNGTVDKCKQAFESLIQNIIKKNGPKHGYGALGMYIEVADNFRADHILRTNPEQRQECMFWIRKIQEHCRQVLAELERMDEITYKKGIDEETQDKVQKWKLLKKEFDIEKEDTKRLIATRRALEKQKKMDKCK